MTKSSLGKKKTVTFYIDKFFIAGLLIIFFVLVASIFYFILKPKYNKVRYGGSSNLQTHEELISAQEIYLDKLKNLQKNFQSLEKIKIDKMFNILPTDKDIPSLFVQLEDIAQINGLSLTSIDMVEKEEITIIRSAEELEKQLAPGIKQLQINLSMQNGNYDKMKNFLSSIENNLRLFDIETLNFNKDALEFDVNLITYYLITDEGS